MCGYMVARLITSITEKGCRIGMLQAVRVGDESANTSILRKIGFADYMRERNITSEIVRIPFTAMEPEKYDEQLDQYFRRYKDIGGVVVLNSRGGIVADYFYRMTIRDIRLICVDLTKPNVEGLRKGMIDFLIGQEPERQGFLAMKTLLEFLIYHGNVKVSNYVSLDILTRDNIEYYDRYNFIS